MKKLMAVLFVCACASAWATDWWTFQQGVGYRFLRALSYSPKYWYASDECNYQTVVNQHGADSHATVSRSDHDGTSVITVTFCNSHGEMHEMSARCATTGEYVEFRMQDGFSYRIGFDGEAQLYFSAGDSWGTVDYMFEVTGAADSDGEELRWTDPATGYTWTYMMKEGKIVLLGVSPEPQGKLVIPSSVDRKNVKVLGNGVKEDGFLSGTPIVEVVIPEGVEELGEGSFHGCRSLKKVVFPSSLRILRENCFERCLGLDSVDIPEGLERIESDVFNDTSIKSLTFPSTVRFFGRAGFTPTIESMYFKGPVPTWDANAQPFPDCIRDNPDALRIYESWEGGFLYVYDSSWDPYVKEGKWQGLPVQYASKSRDDQCIGLFSEKHTFNGLVTDSNGKMLGLVQVVTAKQSSRGEVKVSGFVMLQDGKKQNIKATGKVEGGSLVAVGKAGKTDGLNLNVGGNGFSGSLGSMKLASASVGEDTGILSAMVKLSYFDAKTGKIKTKSMTLGGVAEEGEAIGTLTDKKSKMVKSFEAAIQ